MLLIARLMLAAVFAVAAFGKLLDREGSRRAVLDFGAPARIATPLAALLPLAELAVAGLLLPGPTARYGAIGAAALLLVFCAAIALSLARGRAPDCHCFGTLRSEPAGGWTLGRNGALFAAAAFVAVAGWEDAGPSAVAWLGGLETAELAAVAAGLAAALLAIGGAAVILRLLRAYGRVLVRVDRLEARLAEEGIYVPPDEDERPELGLPVGSRAPEFTLAALGADRVTLADLAAAGNPVVLLFTDPDCGPCRDLAPRIARWQSDHAGDVTVAVVSSGEVAAVRAIANEHGHRRVLLDRDGETYSAYGGAGTPSAVLIDPDLTIASPVVAGSGEIERLVGEAVEEIAAQPGEAPAMVDPAPVLSVRDGYTT